MNTAEPSLNENLRPPGGYKFVDSDKVCHYGTNLKSLVNSVYRYRLRINRPPGNPEREILDQICTKTPRVCVNMEPTHNNRALINLVVADIRQRSFSTEPPAIAPQDIADARMEVCKKCSMRVNWSKQCKPCKPCERSVAGLVADMVKPNRLDDKISGFACLLSREDLTLAVNSPASQSLLDQPAACWRGKDNRD